MLFKNAGAIPETVPHEPRPTTVCKRSCCWTPYGHATRLGCRCHEGEER